MEWDYIVVGGGAAGCVIASRLAEKPGISVLLLEAGGPYSPLLLSAPLPSLRQITRFSWKYFTSQQAGLACRRISLPLARILGGGSSTNAMMYQRGSPKSYDSWRALGNEGWSFRELLPYFRKFEDYCDGNSEYHGNSGPVRISRPRYAAPFSRAFVEACGEIGIPEAADLDGSVGEAAGFFPLTQRRGRLASRLLFGNGRAVGVEYLRDGQKSVARATREIVLCAGSVNSPKLLMLSGVGPADHLKSVGITPVLDLPGVGCNLQDHPRVPVIYESGRGSPGDMKFWIPQGLLYLASGKGVMASNCCESGALVKSSPGKETPDLQFVTHFQTSLYPGAVDIELCLMALGSRGKVRLRSADPWEAPMIDPGYLSEESDVRALISGVRMARRIAQTSALRRFPLRQELMPGNDLTSDREIAAYLRATAETCYHPAGSCKMGNDPLAVVDSSLKVRGIDGLRVADASIMPEIVDGNTCAAALVIAEKAADLVKEGAARDG